MQRRSRPSSGRPTVPRPVRRPAAQSPGAGVPDGPAPAGAGPRGRRAAAGGGYLAGLIARPRGSRLRPIAWPRCRCCVLKLDAHARSSSGARASRRGAGDRRSAAGSCRCRSRPARCCSSSRSSRARSSPPTRPMGTLLGCSGDLRASRVGYLAGSRRGPAAALAARLARLSSPSGSASSRSRARRSRCSSCSSSRRSRASSGSCPAPSGPLRHARAPGLGPAGADHRSARCSWWGSPRSPRCLGPVDQRPRRHVPGRTCRSSRCSSTCATGAGGALGDPAGLLTGLFGTVAFYVVLRDAGRAVRASRSRSRCAIAGHGCDRRGRAAARARGPRSAGARDDLTERGRRRRAPRGRAWSPSRPDAAARPARPQRAGGTMTAPAARRTLGAPRPGRRHGASGP